MKFMRIICIVCVAVVLMASFFLLKIKSQVLFSECEDTVVASFQSPDDYYMVTVFQRDCGATAQIATQVNIQKNYQGDFKPEKGESIMIAEGTPQVSVEWETKDSLKLTYPFVDIFKQITNWGKISIIHVGEHDRGTGL